MIRCERLEPTGCSMPKGLFDRRVVPFVDYVEDKTGFEGVRVVSLQAYPHADSKQLMSGFIYFEH
ncbi:hypothetical protein TW86_04115 [Halomonas sp. S2151]|nr:hypothetical protein TW86_04115 [Halomonas sp. S2151]